MKTEPTLVIMAKCGSTIKIYGNTDDCSAKYATKVALDGTESICDDGELKDALIDAIVAALPFSQAYTNYRASGICEATEDHPNREEFQKFLDSNTVTPNGTTMGNWRKLANVVITEPSC